MQKALPTPLIECKLNHTWHKKITLCINPNDYKFLKGNTGAQSDGSAVNSSSRGPKFDFQHPTCGSKLFVLQFQRMQQPLLPFCGHDTQKHTYTHNQK